MRIFLCFLILVLLPTSVMAVRVDTTKQINVTQLGFELTVSTGVQNIPLKLKQGEFVLNPTDVVSQFELQTAIDAHIAIPDPPQDPNALSKPPRDWRGDYNSRRFAIPAGPIRNMFDLLAEHNGMKEAP